MTRFNENRRRLIQALGASTTLASTGLFSSEALAAPKKTKTIGRVVVIGGGFGGATAAKYLRKWSNGAIEVAEAWAHSYGQPESMAKIEIDSGNAN